MSISNIATNSQKYNAAYNPIVYVNDSTNKNEIGFRYVYNIYSAGTSTLLGSYLIAPRYGDGYGVLQADKLLQNFTTYNFSGTTNPAPVKESWIKYQVKVGGKMLEEPTKILDDILDATMYANRYITKYNGGDQKFYSIT
jgi:hypothetical protein